MLDGVGHDEFLHGQLVDEFLELVVGAESVEAEAVDVARALPLQVLRLLPDGLPRPDHVREQDHVAVPHLLPHVHRVVVEPHPAPVVEQPEGAGELRDCAHVQPVGPRPHDHRVLHARVDQVGRHQLGRLDVQEGGVLREALRRRHEGVESDHFVAAQRLQHLHQVCAETGVEVDAFGDVLDGGQRGGQGVGEERDYGSD